MGEGRWIYDGEGKRERRDRHVMVKGRGREERETCDGEGKRGRREKHVMVSGRREMDI